MPKVLQSDSTSSFNQALKHGSKNSRIQEGFTLTPMSELKQEE